MTGLTGTLAGLTPASAVCLAISVHAAYSVPYFLLVDAHRADFDPRPALRRAIETGRFDPALVAVANARHDAHRAVGHARAAAVHAAISAAALLALLTAPEGTTR